MSEARKYANIFLAAADGLDGPPHPDCRQWTIDANESAQAKAFRGIGRMFAKIADAEEAPPPERSS